MLSERDGYSHLRSASMGGNLIKKVTDGEYEVKKFFGIRRNRRRLLYYTANESPMRKAVYKNGQEKERKPNFRSTKAPTRRCSAKR